MRSLGAHIGDRIEADLISTIVERHLASRPTLVSFNGHGFDLPAFAIAPWSTPSPHPACPPVPTTVATTTPLRTIWWKATGIGCTGLTMR